FAAHIRFVIYLPIKYIRVINRASRKIDLAAKSAVICLACSDQMTFCRNHHAGAKYMPRSIDRLIHPPKHQCRKTATLKLRRELSIFNNGTGSQKYFTVKERWLSRNLLSPILFNCN